MSTLIQDLKFAIRSLRRRWMVTTLATLSLALAIGGNAAVFSLVDGFIFRPLPYPEPERVIMVGEREKDQPELSGFGTSLPAYADLVERGRSVAIWAAMQPITMSLRGSDRSEAISSVQVTPSFFELMQVQAIRGRLFTEAESVEGGPKVLLLRHEYWVRTYGLDTDPIGEVLTLNGEPHEIIGILPEGFEFLTPGQELWLPLQRSPQSAARDQRTVLAIGRMSPNATMEQVRAEHSSISAALENEYPETQRGWTNDTFNLRYDVPDPQSRMLFGMLQGSVLLVLLIACVNITNLLLARGQERSREIALRTALGAGRGRIVRQLLTESSLMVIGGGLGGIALGAIGIRAISRQFVGLLPAAYAVQLDHRVLLFSLGISVVAGLMFGLVPSLQTFKQGHTEALKEGGNRSGSGRSRKTLSRVLVIGEIALSFVALGGGSLLVRSFLEIQSSDPGFEAASVLTGVVSIPSSKYPEDEDRLLLYDQLLARARALGGVETVALANALPQSPFAVTDSFRVSGAPVDASVAAPRSVVIQTSPEYLETLGIDLLQGRFFEDGDRLDAAPVVAVNQTLARSRFEGRSALGQRLFVQGESREIVGVVEDVQQVLIRTGGAESGETIYVPVAQETEGVGFFVLKTRSTPLEAAEPLRGALLALDPDLALSQVQSMEEYTAQFFVGLQVFNAILGGFGLIALLLASMGTYGVLAYSVSQRRREIGIRMALGAEGKGVVRMFAKQGFWLGAIGLALGALMTIPLVGFLRSLMDGISTVDSSTLFLIAAVLFSVTMVASFVPAARAATVNPIQTLRDD